MATTRINGSVNTIRPASDGYNASVTNNWGGEMNCSSGFSIAMVYSLLSKLYIQLTYKTSMLRIAIK